MNNVSDTVAEPRRNALAGRVLWAMALTVVLVVMGAYSPAIPGPFLFDDGGAITGNRTIEDPVSIGDALRPPPITALTGRPITNLSFVLNAALNRAVGVDRDSTGTLLAKGFRIGNLVLHLCTGLLLWGLVRLTLRAQPYSAWWADHADHVSAAVVTLWLLHPLQTESINYVVQRTEVLASAFYAGTLYTWARSWQALTDRRRNGWRMAAVMLCLAGMGAKEMMVTAPLIVILYDRAFMVRGWRELLSDRARTAWYAALFVTTIVVVRTVFADARASTVGFGIGMSGPEYLLSQGWAIPHYLRLALWPDALTLDYGYHLIGAPGWPGLIALTAGGVATVWAWTRAERWGWLAFLASWFYVILAPSSSFLPIVTEIAAERRMYLPLLAVIMLLAIGCVVALRRFTQRPMLVASGIAVALSVAAAAGTFARSRDYRSAEGIWRDAIAKRPSNPRAWLNLGTEMLLAKPPRLSEAESLFAQAVRLDPAETSAWYNLGEVAVSRGDYQRARAMYERALVITPNHEKAKARFAEVQVVLARDGNAMRLAVASGEALEAGRADSAVVLARRALDEPDVTIDVYGLVASVFLRTGRAAAAELVLGQAIALDSTNAQLWSGLGSAQGTLEKWSAAEASYRRALAIDPQEANARRGLQLVLRLKR